MLNCLKTKHGISKWASVERGKFGMVERKEVNLWNLLKQNK